MTTVIGEAFVAISPESAGFASKLKAQLGASDIGSVIGKATGIGVAVAFTGALLASGVEFQKVNQTIQNQTGATGKVLVSLADTVKQVFTQVPASLKDTTAAVDELYQRGVPLGSLIGELAKQELFLAKITGTDLAANVQSTTALFAKFNIPLAQQSQELDVLFKAQQRSGLGLDALLTPLLSSGAVFQQYGFNLAQSAALTATLEKAGVNLQPALAALRLAFGKLAQAGQDPRAKLDDLIKSLSDGKNPAVAMADAIKLFGNRSGVELATAMQKGDFSFKTLLADITNGKGGIDATGLATLSLGNRFKLLRNQIEAGIEPLGTDLVTIIERLQSGAGPPIVDLLSAVARLISVLSPGLGAALLLVSADLQGVGILVHAFATGLNLIADVLDTRVGKDIIEIVGGLLLLGAALTAGRVAWLLYAGTIDLASLSMNAYLVVAVLVVTAVGGIVDLMGAQGRRAAATAKAVQSSFTDSTGVIVAGATSAKTALAAYTVEQEKAVDKNLPGVLAATGSTMAVLAKHVFQGTAEWEKYRAEALANAKAAGNGASQLATIAGVLDKTRHAVFNGIQADLAKGVSSGLVTSAQIAQLESTDRLKDGTIDWNKVLTDANLIMDSAKAKLAAIAGNTDAAALKAFQATGAYRKLIAELDSGKITVTEFYAALSTGAGITDALAKTTGDAAVTLFQSFVTAAEGALPTIASLIDSTAAALTTATSNVTSAVAAQVSAVTAGQQAVASAMQSGNTGVQSAQDQLAKAIQGRATNIANATDQYAAAAARNDPAVISAQQAVTKAMQTSQAAIAKAQVDSAKTVADAAAKVAEARRKAAFDADPQRFTDSLTKSNTSTVTFMGNLQTLVNEHLGPLAASLVQKGGAAGEALAKGFAADPVKAKAAERAIELAQAITATFDTFLRTHGFNTVSNDGTAMGKKLMSAALVAIEAEFPKLAAAIKQAFDIAATGAAASSTTSKPGAASIWTTHGALAAAQWTDGFTGGITAGSKKVTFVVGKSADEVAAEARRRLGIHSPSSVAHSIGVDFGAGLAAGIESMTGAVAVAGGKLSTSALSGLSRLRSSPLEKSGLAIAGQSGFDRADAQRQAPLIGQWVQNEKIDPVHVAAELAWRFR